MRFTAVILSIAMAIASVSGQVNDTSATNSLVASASPSNATQAKESVCFAKCAAGDSACLQECVVAAATSIAATASVNRVALCQGNCTQGNGSAANNLAYQECFIGCGRERVYLATSTSTVVNRTTSFTRLTSGTGAATTGTSLNASTRGNATPSSTLSLNTSGSTGAANAGTSFIAAALLLAFTIAL